MISTYKLADEIIHDYMSYGTQPVTYNIHRANIPFFKPSLFIKANSINKDFKPNLILFSNKYGFKFCNFESLRVSAYWHGYSLIVKNNKINIVRQDTNEAIVNAL